MEVWECRSAVGDAESSPRVSSRRFVTRGAAIGCAALPLVTGLEGTRGLLCFLPGEVLWPAGLGRAPPEAGFAARAPGASS